MGLVSSSDGMRRRERRRDVTMKEIMNSLMPIFEREKHEGV